MKTGNTRYRYFRLSHFFSFFALALVVTLAACGTRPVTTAAPPMEPSRAGYHLGPGDKLNINVFGDESLSGSHQVDGNGSFTFPLVGNIKAVGMTSSDLEEMLRGKLTEYLRDPRVSVEIASYRPFYIVGEVKLPGSYPYVDGMTVINAVAIAGGFTYRAKDDGFDIQRKSQDISLAGNQTTLVMPGDVITVRERFF